MEQSLINLREMILIDEILNMCDGIIIIRTMDATIPGDLRMHSQLETESYQY